MVTLGVLLLVFHRATRPPPVCSSVDPCHCRTTRTSCLCAAGTSGPDCLQTECNWHEETLSHGGQCDTCNSHHHCHGCTTKDTCDAANAATLPTHPDDARDDTYCAWRGDRCQNECSSYACSSCATESGCMQRALCHWVFQQAEFGTLSMGNGQYGCQPRCDRHACSGCMTQEQCTAASSDSEENLQVPGCTWDPNQSICVHTCESTLLEKEGLGCWTCTTEFLCRVAHHGCAWDGAESRCTGSNSEELAVMYGDVVNPARSALSKVDSVVGNLLVEHAERTGQHDDEIYDHWASASQHTCIVRFAHTKCDRLWVCCSHTVCGGQRGSISLRADHTTRFARFTPPPW
jgi:hypothetical protein